MFKSMSKVVNHEGAPAYAQTPELELYTAVVTTSLSNTFYEEQGDRMNRIVELVGKVSPEFVAQLAVYTRTEMHLRSVPLLLLVELAKVHKGDDLVARAVEKTVLRADEIMELLICYQMRNPTGKSNKKIGPLSHQLQNGLERAFNHFDEYQFAKYDRDNLEVKLRDALFLVHPKAKDIHQQEIFDKITNRQLATPYTWETELSALGQQQFASATEREQAFGEKWSELIMSGKVGYMALMRNLRNMLQAQVPYHIMEQVSARLSDPVQVAKSKQLPFRYLSAFRELLGVTSTSTQLVLTALENAVKHSANNIEGFDPQTRVLLACDVSGSMYSRISANSTVSCYDIGLLLAMLLRNRCHQVITGIFGDTWLPVNLPSDNILMATQNLRSISGKVGYSTNGYEVIKWLIENQKVMDKVMLFTDLQMWDSRYGGTVSIEQTWKAYKKIAPDAKLYLFDLVGYGNTPLRMVRPDVYLIAGWSDRIFDVLSAIEHGGDTLDAIRNIKL